MATIDAYGLCEITTEFEGHLAKQPQVIDAVSSHLGIRVTFDSPMLKDDALSDPANYEISLNDADAVEVVILESNPGPADEPTWVDLVCSEMTDGASYAVEAELVDGPTDHEGIPLDPAHYGYGFSGVGVEPTVVSAIATSKNRVEVKFSETMYDNAMIKDTDRYTFDKGLLVLGIVSLDKDIVTLATGDQVPGELYTLTVTAQPPV